MFKVYPCKTSASRNPSEPCLWAPLTFWCKLGKYGVKFIVLKDVQHRCVHSTSLPPLQKEEMVKSLSHTLWGLRSWATETVQSNWLLVSRNTRPECPVEGKGEGLLLHLSVLSQDIKGRGGNGLHLDLLFWGGFISWNLERMCEVLPLHFIDQKTNSHMTSDLNPSPDPFLSHHTVLLIVSLYALCSLLNSGVGQWFVWSIIF